MGDKIQDWIRQQPLKDKTSVFIEPKSFGTGGALKYLEGKITAHSFWVLNGDSLLPEMNFQKMEETHRKAAN